MHLEGHAVGLFSVRMVTALVVMAVAMLCGAPFAAVFAMGAGSMVGTRMFPQLRLPRLRLSRQHPSASVGLVVACMLMLASFAVPCRAQGVANLYAAGMSYNAGGSPSVAGTALYAHQVNTTGTYAFTMFDALPATTKPFTVTTNVAAGVAQKLVTIAGFDVLVPTSAGISFSGTNTGWAWSTGAAVPIPIKKNGYYLIPTVRVLKSSVSGGSGYQPVIGILFGWGK